MKDHVEIGHLTKYDAFRVKRDRVKDLEICFKIQQASLILRQRHFGGCCLKIREVCMDFERYFKVDNSVFSKPHRLVCHSIGRSEIHQGTGAC